MLETTMLIILVLCSSYLLSCDCHVIRHMNDILNSEVKCAVSLCIC